MHLYYSPAYTAAGYSFETTHKASWIAESLATFPIPGVELIEPPLLTQEQLTAVHDADYITAVRTGHPMRGAHPHDRPEP